MKLEIEIWKSVVSWVGYRVSSFCQSVCGITPKHYLKSYEKGYMRRVLRKGFQEFEIYNWRDIRFMEFKDRFLALEFLNGFTDDPYYMMVLRNILERELIFKNIASLSDFEVLEELASLMVSKHIKILARFDTIQPSILAAEVLEEVAPVEAVTEEPEEAEEEPEEVEEFLPAIAEAQAEALKRAAQSGATMCEA